MLDSSTQVGWSNAGLPSEQPVPARQPVPIPEGVDAGIAAPTVYDLVDRQSPGLTLARYSRATHLNVDWLKDLGMFDLWAGDRPVVRTPYRRRDGSRVGLRDLTTLDGKGRPKTLKNQFLPPYGLWLLDEAERKGHVVLVQGERAAHVLWHHAIPALGVLGPRGWHSQREAGVLDGIPLVYIALEEDQTIDRTYPWLLGLGIADRVKLIRLGQGQGIVAAHVADPAQFPLRWQTAFDAAEPWVQPQAWTVLCPPLPAAVAADDDWPAPPAQAAFIGLAGQIVDVVDKHGEADPVAVLGHVLAAFGNAVGTGPHAMVGATKHPPRDNFVFVGKSAKARKGDSWNPVRRLFEAADPDWLQQRVQNGLASGEGLLWAVRDRVVREELVTDDDDEDAEEDGDRGTRYETVVVDPGVKDRRLMVVETEFGRVLRVAGREGNTLSSILREAWDSGDLRSLTKNSPAAATGAHVSLVGHVTADELQHELKYVDAVNGFGNRIVWLAVKRSKLVAEPEAFAGPEVDRLAQQLADTLAWAKTAGELTRVAAASSKWREVYPHLSREQPGLVGAVLGRAEAHTLRLSLVYALLDKSPLITVAHLEAALALWEYVERSVVHIFSRHPSVTHGLRSTPEAQLVRLLEQAGGRLQRGTILRKLRWTADDLNRVVGTLGGQVEEVEEQSGGRPAQWLRLAISLESTAPQA